MDFEYLKCLLNHIGLSNFKTRTRKNSKSPLTNVRLAQQEKLKCLKDFGFLTRNVECPIFFKLNSEMQKFFIKGFLDGDGSVSCDKNGLFRVCFYGAKNQNWDFLNSYCQSLNLIPVIYRKERKSHHISHKKETHSYSVLEFTKMQEKIDFCKSLEFLNIGICRKIDVYKNFKQKRLEEQKNNQLLKTMIF